MTMQSLIIEKVIVIVCKKIPWNLGSHISRLDYLTLSYIGLRFNCGTGIATIISKDKIKLGSWHSVTVFRDGIDGWLSLDNSPQVPGKSQVSY